MDQMIYGTSSFEGEEVGSKNYLQSVCSGVEDTSCAIHDDIRDFGGGEMQKFQLNGHIWHLMYLG
jgi:hypothetical protein